MSLSTDPGSPITVVSTITASGKTTLMNAIYWCLYGIDLFRPHSLLNIERQQELLDGEKETVAVELVFDGYSGKKRISRSIEYEKMIGRIVECPGSERISGDRCCELYPDAQIAAPFFVGNAFDITNPRFSQRLGKKLSSYYLKKFRILGEAKARVCVEKLLAKIAACASVMFNQVYFRPGVFEICWLGQFCLRKAKDDTELNTLSYTDQIVYNIALLHGVREVLFKENDSSIDMPIIVDDFFVMVSPDQFMVDQFVNTIGKRQALILVHQDSIANQTLPQICGRHYRMVRGKSWSNVTIEQIT